MALVLKDRVKETTTVTGTGTATLLGAVAGFQDFSAVGNANTTYYCIAAQTGTEWEVGIGTYTSSGTTLSRDTILASSNSNTAVSFSAGTKDAFVTYPASTSVNLDLVQTLTNKTLTAPTLTSTVLNDGYTEEVYAVVDAAGVALSPTNGSMQTWTLGASRTPTAGIWAAGQSMVMMIDDGTAYTITWTSLPVTWLGGVAPSLATSGYTVITLWKVGTTIYGSLYGAVA